MLKNIIQLTKKLVSIKSTTGNTKDLDKILDIALSHLKEYRIERFERNGIKSALVYNSPKRPKKFKVILNAHLDIIPGKDSQYTPRIKGSKLYGAGSMDMKASAACLIMAFKKVANQVNYPLGLQLVTDEEVGGFDGAKYQIEKGVMADFVIAGESTNFDIVNKAKGVLKIKISTYGKAAHGAYPWMGENAVWKMNNFLNILKKKFPDLKREQWITTVNLAKIETTNQALNKIPEDCTVLLDIRYIPEEEDNIVYTIKRLVPSGFKFSVVAKEPALLTDKNNENIIQLRKVIREIVGSRVVTRGAHGTSDARHFRCPGVEFGPIGGGIGSDNEWVNIPSLGKYCQILEAFLRS